ncbi:MAG: OmpA family protein [Candidatus Binatia bacterium]
MRSVRLISVGTLLGLTLSSCTLVHDEREWDGCAIGGAIIGGAIGGTVGGVAMNNVDDSPTNSERGGAIAGGLVGGAALGAVLGHLICDPVKAAPAPPPPPPPPPPAPRKIAELKGPNFDFNKATLKPSGKAIVDTAAKAMKDDPKLAVSVEGHTDAIGSEAYNLKLSERRAAAVRDHLVAHGIAASRIATKGFGKSKPVADNGTEEGRAKNRRVEIMAR